MASLAELMFQSASKSISEATPDVGQAVVQGAQLAQRQQQIEMQRAELQNKQQLLSAKRDDKSIEEIKILANSKISPKMKNILAKQFQKRAEERGTPYAPEFLEAMKGVEFDQQKIGNVLNTYQNELRKSLETGKMTPELAEARASVTDIAYGGNLEPMLELESKAIRSQINAEAQAARTQAQIGARAAEAKKRFREAGPKKVATKLGEDFVQYDAVGGRVAMKQNLKDLQEAARKLDSGEVTTGGITTKLPLLSSDEVQSMVNQEMRNVQNDARKAIMPLLRATLGSQFTDKEGERIFGTVFDPKAPAKENARRIRSKISELRGTIRDKEAAFRRGGFLPPAEAEPGIPAAKRDVTLDIIKSALGRLSKDAIRKDLKEAFPNASDEEMNKLIDEAQGSK